MWWGLSGVLLAAAAFSLIPGRMIAVGGDTASEPVLIIDAGHGGEDGGAVAPDGVRESEINLDIALRTEALARFCGVTTVMTRQSGKIDYPPEAQTLAQMKKADQHARLALINSQPNAVLLSIHQNNYPAPAPNGIQVFYNKVGDSAGLAALIQENLTASLCPDNRRYAEPADDGIYLMRCSEKPSILVECGFLSNPGDLACLEDPVYRTELAVVILASCLQYIRGALI